MGFPARLVLNGALARFRKNVRQEDGAATVEVVLWLPVMALLFALVADTAMIFGAQAQVVRVVQDGNRAMSTGRIRDPVLVQDTIKAQINGISPGAVVTTTNVDGLISTTVAMPVEDLTATGLVDAFANLTVRVRAQHLSEDF